MRPPGVRPRRVAHLLREELSRLLLPAFQTPETGFLAVTRVEMSADLRSARIAVAVFGGGDPKAALARLEARRGALRKALAPRLKLKYNPELIFELDPGPAHEDRIDALLAETKKSHDES